MKKINLLLVIVLVVLFSACSDKNDVWKDAVSVGTIDAYQSFIENNPEHEMLTIAQQKIDSIDTINWNFAVDQNTIEAYENYLTIGLNQGFLSEAEEKIEEFKQNQQEIDDWENAIAENTIGAYELFIENYPSSEKILDAYEKIFIINDLEFEDTLSVVREFFKDLYKSENLSVYFHDTCYFVMYGSDYVDDTLYRKPTHEELQNDYGYWNLGWNMYEAFLRGEFERDGLSYTCEMNISEDVIGVGVEYWDNGALGNFGVSWEKKNGEWKITNSFVSLPNFM